MRNDDRSEVARRKNAWFTSLTGSLSRKAAPSDEAAPVKQVSPHPLFDAGWYLQRNPDLPAYLATFVHYFDEGWRDLRSPHPLFSIEYYYDKRPDVKESGLEPLGHFIAYGFKEGSNPHPLFDVLFYLRQSPRLEGLDPLTHYVTTGWKEGLKPNARFSPSWYIEQYPDVRRAGMEPLAHFLMHGLYEKRRYSATHEFGTHPLEVEVLRIYGLDFELMPGLAPGVPEARGLSDRPLSVGARSHSLDENASLASAARRDGIKQHYSALDRNVAAQNGDAIAFSGNSQGAELNLPVRVDDYYTSTQNFDAFEYALIYPDVRRAFNFDPESCRRHWLSSGRKEGRFGPGVSLFFGRKASVADVLKKPFGLNIYGPFGAISGLGIAARNLAEAVRSSDVPFELHAFDVSQGLPRVTPDARSRTGTYRANLILANADQIENVIRLYPDGHFDGYYNIAEWAWELASFRPDWFGVFGAVDEVWAYSSFAVDAISANAPIPIRKMPLPIIAEAASCNEARERFGIPQDKFVFLTVFDVGSTTARKNPMAVVKAFAEAFGDDPDTFLIVKFHATQSYGSDLLRELTEAVSGLSNAVAISDRLSEVDMDLLRAAANCLVSAHRSEGFGLNLGEFMALGKAVVATDYSGNVDFFSKDVGYPVDYRLVEIEEQAGPYLPGYVWAEPDFASLVKQMKLAFDERERSPRSQAAKDRIKNFSPAAIGKAIGSRLEALDLDKNLGESELEFSKYLCRSRTIANPSLCATLNQETRDKVDKMAFRPRLSIIVPVYNVPPRYLRECIESVRSQSYPFWELCLCDDASPDQDTVGTLESYRGLDARIKIRRLTANAGIAGASNAAVEIATGEFLVFLDNDDVLAPDALMEIALALNEDRSLDCVYTDEEKIDERGDLIDHFYKPDWSPEHLESVMYVLHALVVRKRLFFELGGLRSEYDGAQDFDLMLRVSRATKKIRHIQRALYKWRAIPGSAAAVVDAKPFALESGFRALADHVREKYGARARVEKGLLPGTFRVRRPYPLDTRVALLILTNNGEIELPGRGRIRLVDNFVDSILSKTTYPNYEIVVVDNSRLSAKQIKRFKQMGVRVENYLGQVKPFNYAAKANFSVRCARSEHLVILNDDMEILNEDWLAALMELAQDREIGGVGSKLTHADGTIQHVGMVLGVNGGAAHPYHGFPGEYVGYNAFTHIIRNYSAVTGACFATRASVISEVGGFDERFAVDYNDTDLCLRILERGYRIVYTPFARLSHFEGFSIRRHEQNPTEVGLFVKKWAKYVENDPYYNINLSRQRHDFACREDRESSSITRQLSS